jgi:hypothetical protein
MLVHISTIKRLTISNVGNMGWAGRSVEDRLLCKQEAMGSNPIRSI